MFLLKWLYSDIQVMTNVFPLYTFTCLINVFSLVFVNTYLNDHWETSATEVQLLASSQKEVPGFESLSPKSVWACS